MLERSNRELAPSFAGLFGGVSMPRPTAFMIRPNSTSLRGSLVLFARPSVPLRLTLVRPPEPDRATAERFAEEGAKVVVTDIDVTAGEAAARSARTGAANSGGDAHFVRCDVTERASIEAAIAETVGRYGKLDIVHNNAGGSTLQDGPVTDEEFWRVIRLDLCGTFLCRKIAIPEIVKAGGGAVINMSSNVALMALLGRSATRPPRAASPRGPGAGADRDGLRPNAGPRARKPATVGAPFVDQASDDAAHGSGVGSAGRGLRPLAEPHRPRWRSAAHPARG
jgi:hypothetical protein